MILVGYLQQAEQKNVLLGRQIEEIKDDLAKQKASCKNCHDEVKQERYKAGDRYTDNESKHAFIRGMLLHYDTLTKSFALSPLLYIYIYI